LRLSVRWSPPLLAVALVGLGLLTAPLAQANFLGAAKDPAGDAADPSPARDIVAAAIAYDRRSGELRGGIALRGAPASETSSFIGLFAGVRTAKGCNGYPAIGFGSYSDEWGASWARLEGPGPPSRSGEADKTGYLDPVQEFEISTRALAGRKVDCVVATLTEPGNATVVYDGIGPIPLRALPALEATLGEVSEPLRPGQQRRIKLTLRNPGDALTGRVKISFKRARGLQVQAPRKLAPIRPGKRRTVTIKVTLNKRASNPTTLSAVIAAGKLSARVEESLYFRSPPSGGNGDGGEGSSPQLCNRWLPDLSGESGGSLTLVPC
jgi:hypothetical protein